MSANAVLIFNPFYCPSGRSPVTCGLPGDFKRFPFKRSEPPGFPSAVSDFHFVFILSLFALINFSPLDIFQPRGCVTRMRVDFCVCVCVEILVKKKKEDICAEKLTSGLIVCD